MVIKYKDIEPEIIRKRLILEFHALENITKEQFRSYIEGFSSSMGMSPHPEQPVAIITSATGHSLEKHNGYEGMLFWLESGLHSYYWEKQKFITVDMYSCADLDIAKSIAHTKNHFTIFDYTIIEINTDGKPQK